MKTIRHTVHELFHYIRVSAVPITSVSLRSSSSSMDFIGGWQTNLKVRYRHLLDWSVGQ